MEPEYIQQNNEPIAPGELRRTLIHVGKELRRHQEVLTAMQVEVSKLIQASESFMRVLQGHDAILAAATRPAAKPTGDMN